MSEPLPLEELFVPLACDAENKLRRQLDAATWGLLTPEAHGDWTRYLLIRLTTAGAQAARWQFQIFKTVRSAFPAKRCVVRSAPDAVYRQFVGVPPDERLQKLLAEFPALAQLCGVLVDNWVATVSEFLFRLQSDRPGLHARFPSSGFTRPVARLELGLSDPHNGGRSVVRLRLADGASVIYKPRSLAPETQFAGLLDHLNVSGITHDLRSAQCWERAGYGWMEDVLTGACANIEEIQRFYWRAGALLGLVHSAHGVDFHQENLIAAGQHPVLIDLETLWHPQHHFGDGQSSGAATSVLRTGFLPQLDPRVGKLYEWSALARTVRRNQKSADRCQVDDDQTKQKSDRKGTAGGSHLPSFSGVFHPATGFASEVEAGFRWVGYYRFGRGRKRFERWRNALAACPRRLVMRSTIYYQKVLDRLTTPQCLRQTCGCNRSAIQPVLFGAALLPVEAQALQQMDIPYFAQNAGGCDDPSMTERPELTEENYFAQVPVITGALVG